MTNDKTITFEDGKTQKISLKKGEQYYLDFDSVEDTEVEYSIKGKDLILTVKPDSEKEIQGGSIVLKNYASKDVSEGVYYPSPDDLLDNYISFAAAHKKNSFTGTRFADVAESTEKNETFKLGTGSNTISFDTKAGFGKDTVTLTSGENLTLDISNTDNLSYEVQGKNLVVKADSVSYVAEAKVSGTVDGVEIPENTYSFTLTEYETPDDRNDSLRGKYLFKGCEYGDNGTFEDGKRAIYLTNSDFKEDSVTFDGATLSEFKVYKVVNGEKIDITEEYKKGIASANDADDSYNKILAEEEGLGGSIVLKDYAVKDNGVTVAIGEEDSDLAETLEFEVVAGKKNTFTGTRLNNTATSTEKNDTFKLGTGKDTITFGENFGNDTVVLSNGEELVLNFAEDTELTYSKKGNSIILTDKNNNSVTVKDYLKGNAMVSVGSDDLTDLINESKADFLTYGKGADYKKAQTLKGTLLDETFVSGKGNDKLYGGGGINTYQFAAGSGKDTVYATGEQDILNFDEDVKLTYSRKGNDIVISGTKTTEDKSEVVNQVTVKNYLKGDQNVYVGEEELISELNAQGFTYGNAESKKAQKLSGSLLDETFVGGAKADKIYTGSGDDTINAGAGNDTIYVNGTGTKSITIGKADGNDTIVMSSVADLDLTYGGEGEPRYVRKGNDLVISYKYSDVEKEQVTTIKNYYKYTNLGDEYDDEYGATLTVNEKNVTDNMVVTEVIGSAKNDKYDFDNYVQNAEIVVTDKKGNDIYNVEDFSTNIIIDDRAGRDTLNLNVSTDNMSIIFNVDKNGNANGSLFLAENAEDVVNETGNSVELVNYFGKGKIETITSYEGENIETVDMSSWVAKVTSDVQSWLGGTDYADAMAVLESGNETDITALLAVYQNASYEAATPVA